MNKILLFLLLAGSSYSLTAQNNDINCGNGRYTNDVFTNVVKTADIVYGYNTTTDYSTNTTYNHTLLFDFYEPVGDPAVKRPLVILAFGGGFIGGQRSDLEPICIALAKKGYATATIDYRLIYNSIPNILLVFNTPALLTDEVVKATADFKAAIRFFKHDAATTNTYRIDPTKIIIGGASAGAIAAMHTAYTDDELEYPGATASIVANGGFEGNTDLQAPNNLLPTYNASGIAAVLNIAGGLADTSLVDANNPPLYSSQGDADDVVPYNYGPLSYNGFATTSFIYGSHLIQTRANNIGLRNELYSIPGGDHESPGIEPHISKIITDASAFLESISCGSTLPVTLTNFSVQSNNCIAVLNWKTATEQQSSHYDIETSKDGNRFTKIATVQSKNSIAGSSYTYKLDGYTQAAWFRLKMADKDGRFTYSAVQKFNPACVASVQVFPNPAKSHATVAGLEAGMQVSPMNAEGKLLWKQIAAGNTMQIPVSTFANGLLLVQVKDNNGKILANSKLIKN